MGGKLSRRKGREWTLPALHCPKTSTITQPQGWFLPNLYCAQQRIQFHHENIAESVFWIKKGADADAAESIILEHALPRTTETIERDGEFELGVPC
jgi:hypothetical protein